MVSQTVPVVQTAGLCKTFKDFWHRPKVEAVKDLTLDIRPGEVFGLLGPNGSGKSTTIKMLLGLLYPTRGRISVFGKAPTDVNVKARIGFLPEESYLYRFLTAQETLDYYGTLFRLPGRIRRERTETLLDMVGLGHETSRVVGEYSKGMQRRIGLAQALINDPEFLILDEPTAGLDPIGTRQIKDVIRNLGDKGKTILLSSHMLSDVEDVCDRVTILYGGQQQAAGSISDLLEKSNLTQITAPALSEETLAKLRDMLSKLEEKDIFEVSHPRMKLEEFFLKIVSEAQAKNVRTSGARKGGAVPEFLRKATEVTTHDVVDSLVEAANPKAETVEQVPAANLEPKEAPGKEVLDDLLASRGAEPAGESAETDTDDPTKAIETLTGSAAPTDEGAAEDQPTPDEPASPKQRKAPVQADRDLIEGLLSGGDSEGTDKPS